MTDPDSLLRRANSFTRVRQVVLLSNTLLAIGGLVLVFIYGKALKGHVDLLQWAMIIFLLEMAVLELVTYAVWRPVVLNNRGEDVLYVARSHTSRARTRAALFVAVAGFFLYRLLTTRPVEETGKQEKPPVRRNVGNK